MTKVLIITEEQKTLIQGKEFAKDCHFNCVKDINDNWVISVLQRNQITITGFDFLNELTEVEYFPIVFFEHL